MGKSFKLTNGLLFLSTEAPGGLYNAEQLTKLAALCASDDAVAKATEDQRLALFVAPNQAAKVAAELKAVGLGVRHYQDGMHQPINCLGALCGEHLQDAMGTGMDLADELAKVPVTTPLKIGINGCARCCLSTHTLDISMIGESGGYRVSLGGKNSQIPEMASFMAEGVPAAKLPKLISKVIAIYKELAHDGESLQETMERAGTQRFVDALAPYSQDAHQAEPVAAPVAAPALVPAAAEDELTIDDLPSADDDIKIDDLPDTGDDEMKFDLPAGDIELTGPEIDAGLNSGASLTAEPSFDDTDLGSLDGAALEQAAFDEGVLEVADLEEVPEASAADAATLVDKDLEQSFDESEPVAKAAPAGLEAVDLDVEDLPTLTPLADAASAELAPTDDTLALDDSVLDDSAFGASDMSGDALEHVPDLAAADPLELASDDLQGEPGVNAADDLELAGDDLSLEPGVTAMAADDLELAGDDMQGGPGVTAMAADDLELAGDDLSLEPGVTAMAADDLELAGDDLSLEPSVNAMAADDLELAGDDLPGEPAANAVAAGDLELASDDSPLEPGVNAMAADDLESFELASLPDTADDADLELPSDPDLEEEHFSANAAAAAGPGALAKQNMPLAAPAAAAAVKANAANTPAAVKPAAAAAPAPVTPAAVKPAAPVTPAAAKPAAAAAPAQAAASGLPDDEMIADEVSEADADAFEEKINASIAEEEGLPELEDLNSAARMEAMNLVAQASQSLPEANLAASDAYDGSDLVLEPADLGDLAAGDDELSDSSDDSTSTTPVAEKKGPTMAPKAVKPAAAGKGFEFTGLDISAEGRISLLFASGAALEIDPRTMVASGRREFKLAGKTVTLSPRPGGLNVEVDGMAIFVPDEAAA